MSNVLVVAIHHCMKPKINKIKKSGMSHQMFIKKKFVLTLDCMWKSFLLHDSDTQKKRGREIFLRTFVRMLVMYMETFPAPLLCITPELPS
jgi:hypothetical protein